MTLLQTYDEAIDARVARGLGGRFYGVYPAVVTDLVDPDGQARVRVRLPWSPDTGRGAYEVWARLATMMAGDNRGSYIVPDVGDEVLVAFGGGDPRHPFVVGALWNGVDSPPERMDAGGSNDRKVLRSRNGVQVTMVDTNGREELKLETPGGQSVTLTDAPAGIELRDSSGNRVQMGPGGVSVTTSARVSVEASTVEITAAQVTINAGVTRCSGIVQADTVITNSVVSASYTPGAGNIW